MVLEDNVKGLSRQILEFLNGQELPKISTRIIKREMDLQNIPRRTFTRAVGEITDNPNSGWILEGRSLARRQVAADFGFSSPATE